ncbi:interleukin-18 receptor 1-like isoform X1 [Ambystoma mexicanum]|uniref:interleukin-18 receptor 1-like isoform X1 n=1 Tax=Ambystoma mexicanum TaxID=8296 RepID=UPI0037E8616F
MNLIHFATVLVVLGGEPLAGNTGNMPWSCGLEGELSILECRLPTSNILENTQNAVNWFTQSGMDGLAKVTTGASGRIVFSGMVLRFLPAEVNDTGIYFCRIGNVTSPGLFFKVLEKNKNTCFSALCRHSLPATRGTGFNIQCEIDKYYEHRNIKIMWYKDCHFYRENATALFFNELKKNDSGNYTCAITLKHAGKEYRHSRTTYLEIEDPEEPLLPNILGDDGITYEDVEIGKSKILSCTAVTGYSNKADVVNLYWLRENSFIDLNGLNESFTNSVSDGRMYQTSELHFKSVEEEHLKSHYNCVLTSVKRTQKRTFVLKKKEKSTDIPGQTFTTGMIIAIVSSGVVVALAVSCFLCRIEIALAYRSLTGKDETLSDGKEYDAYVSYLKESVLDDEEERIFALQILPRTLEDHFGYNLCIFERDVLPGQAIVDEINSRIDKSRRLIIILSKKYLSDGAIYELESGLYKSLVERKIKVILIEYNLKKDLKFLPESLHLLKSSSKVRWKEEKSMPLNSRFWKKMRYLLPAKPRRSNTSKLSDMMLSSNKSHSFVH